MENSKKSCDHTSVGILIWRGSKLLLIERKKFPFGFAPPAGHVTSHGTFEKAASEELREEVGLDSKNLKILAEGRKENRCRMPDGFWHYWKIYEADTEGEITRSLDETKQAGWYDIAEIKKLTEKTEKYLKGEISDEEWQNSPGIETVWYDWFKELKII